MKLILINIFLTVFVFEFVFSKKTNYNDQCFRKNYNDQCSRTNYNDQCFRAAIYEHQIVQETIDQDPIKILNINLNIFERVVKKASKYNTNIIVFPEYSLLPEISRNDTFSKGVACIIPDINTTFECPRTKINKKSDPYDEEVEKINDDIVANKFLLRRLSCLASNYNIYISANLFELEKNLNKTDSNLNYQNEDYLLYNVNVVFDNRGKLVAKYRKSNLFDEIAMSQPVIPEIITFESEFGKFGLSICADSLHKNPIDDLVKKEKIDHLIFSTAWADSFPHVFSLNFHSSLAIKYRINVLSANRRNYSRGAIGSGIFSGIDGVKVQTFLDDKQKLLAIADLPRNNSNLANRCNYKKLVKIGKKEYKEFFNQIENLSYLDYKPVINPVNLLKLKQLDTNEGNITDFCAEDICCSLEWKINANYYELDDYYLMITSRSNHTYEPKIYQFEEGCSLASFDSIKNEFVLASSTRFDKLTIKGKFNTSQIYPNVIGSNLKVIPKNRWIFKQNVDENEAEISINNLNKSITFVTLFVRNFDKYIRDPFRL